VNELHQVCAQQTQAARSSLVSSKFWQTPYLEYQSIRLASSSSRALLRSLCMHTTTRRSACCRADPFTLDGYTDRVHYRVHLHQLHGHEEMPWSIQAPAQPHQPCLAASSSTLDILFWQQACMPPVTTATTCPLQRRDSRCR
jgi:hypothetical protein